MKVSRRGKGIRRPRWAVLLVTIAVLEVALRAVLGNYASSELRVLRRHDEPCRLVPGAEVTYDGWFLKIPGVKQSVNEQGFRGAPRPFEKPPDTLRVLVVGDSFVFGQGMPDGSTIPDFLEDSLHASLARPVEALNFGIEGLNVEEALQQYADYAGRWEHDLLLYALSPNDLDRPGCEGPPLVFAFYRNVYVARLPMMVLVMATVLGSSCFGGTPDAAAEQARLVAGLEGLEEATRENGARFGIVVIGNPLDDAEAGKALEKWPVLDVSPLLHDSENTIPREGHFNERGGRRVAGAIDEWIAADPAWGDLRER